MSRHQNKNRPGGRSSISFQIWLVLRQMRSGGRFLGMTTALSILGMIIGVASLVISMSVISGFDTALKSAVIDFSGHLILLKAESLIDSPEELIPRIREIAPNVVSYTPFVQLEGVAASQGQTTGVSVVGLDGESLTQVMDIKGRIVEGEVSLGGNRNEAEAVIGKGLATKFKLKVGDFMQVVAPRPSRGSRNSFSPKAVRLKITGIADLGKYEYDSRFVLMGATQAMELRGGRGYTGIRLKLDDEYLADKVKLKLEAGLGHPYWAKSWVDVSRNLFEAIAVEKRVILIVVLLMVVTACFNICSTLFVNVLKRYTEISILQTMGASPRFIRSLFAVQGLIIGFIGSVLGLGLGVALSYYLPTTSFFKIPGEVYKLDHLSPEIRFTDVGTILLCSMLICFVSTFAPARKGARLKPVDGLRYE